jgi:hypothetical protein
MFYKSIFNAVAVAVAVMAVMLIGCGGDTDGDGSVLVGDWSVMYERYGGGEELQMPDNKKVFYSFKTSGDLTVIELYKIGDFWVESAQESGKYRVRGGAVCIVFIDEEGEKSECPEYSISGNNLTISNTSPSYTLKAVSADRNSLGKVYSRDPLLERTKWNMASPSGIHWHSIHMRTPNFQDNDNYYISFDSYDNVWYTEDNRIIILEGKCDGTDSYGECISYSVGQTVTLNYQLTGSTLRLRLAGSRAAWDAWMSEDF